MLTIPPLTTRNAWMFEYEKREEGAGSVVLSDAVILKDVPTFGVLIVVMESDV